MNRFLGTHPGAQVAGTEYPAKAASKWRSFGRRRPCGPAAGPAPAAAAGIECRTKARQRQWLGLLTWQDSR